MKIPSKVQPWLFLWIPWGGVLLGTVFLLSHVLQTTLNPLPRLVSREPSTDFSFLRKPSGEKREERLGSPHVFLGAAKPSMPEPVVEEPEEPVETGVSVMVSGVVIGSRVRYGVVNGAPYAEGSQVPNAGVVERVQKRGVTIVAESGKRVFVGVGKKVDL